MSILKRQLQVLLLCLWSASNCCALAPDSAVFEQALTTLVADTSPDPTLEQDLSWLYRALDYQPIWRDAELLSQLQAGIAGSYEDGLNPRDYPLPKPSATSGEAVTAAQLAQDIAISAAFITLLKHLYYGKVNPASLHTDWNFEDLRKLDADRELIVVAIRNWDIRGLLQAARPQQQMYTDLKRGLANYREIEAAGGWPRIRIDTLLQSGQRHSAVPSLRRRLRLSGDYSADSEVQPEDGFDLQLKSAVRRFQRRHLLPADGVVGPRTLNALNQPVQLRIIQIRANLERMRWFLKGLDADFLLVDIAGYMLYLVRDNSISWSTPIQVGQPYRQTPVLKSRITYIEWNPSWTIPPTILKEDVLPAIQRDADYLQKHHMQVFSWQGEWIDPDTIEWQRYPGSAFPYLIRQRPGPWNALGSVKFIFANKHQVYLHDTPEKNLFAPSSRAFSSGCIRVAQPHELARILLSREAPLSNSDIEAIVNSGKTRRHYLSRGFPIVLLYWTTKMLDDGTLVFAPDIYHRDARLLRALDAGVVALPAAS